MAKLLRSGNFLEIKFRKEFDVPDGVIKATISRTDESSERIGDF